MNIEGLDPPITKKGVNRGAFYSYRILFNKKFFKKKTTMDIFLKSLRKEGLQARKAGNPPLNLLPYFKGCNPKKIKSSEEFYNNTFSIPTFTFENIKIINLYLKGFKKVCNYYYEKKYK